MDTEKRKKFTSYIPQDRYDQIEELATNLDVSKSKAHNMILTAGLSNWETEIRIIQLEAKLDLIMESFAEEPAARERMKEAVEDFYEEKSMDLSTSDTQEPTDAMKSVGITPEEWSK